MLFSSNFHTLASERSRQFEYSCFLLLEIRAPYVKEGKQFQTWFHSFTYLFPNTNLCFQSSVSALVLPIWSCLDSCFWHLKVSNSFISLKEFSFFKPSHLPSALRSLLWWVSVHIFFELLLHLKSARQTLHSTSL